jgi:16S rRNA (guanine527-N7)-methyltransferase
MAEAPSKISPLALLQEGAATYGLHFPPPVLEQFRIYLEELKRWNARINLTALKTDREIVVKLFLDSLALLPVLGEAASLADLGSGAGFPGLVLKIARPELNVTLVESRGKKAAFLEYVVAVLKLTQVEVAAVHLTPQLAATWGRHYDVVVSRAAFSLAELLKLAAPLLLPGGRVLAVKGAHLPPAELAAARKLCRSLGLADLELRSYNLFQESEPRLLVSTALLKGAQLR